jgi:hypothetical protein
MPGCQVENDTGLTQMSSMADTKCSCGHLPVHKNLLHQSAARELLRHEAVDVLRQPLGVQAFGRLVQTVFREAIVRAQASEGLCACRFVRTGNTASSLPGRVGFHALEALHGLGEQGIIELAGAFKMSMQLGRLPWVHLQGQGEDKRGRWLVSHAPSR